MSETHAFTDPRAAEIVAIVAKESGVDPARLVPDARIADLGIASIDMVQSIFEIETRFDVELPVIADQTGGEFETVGSLVAHVLATLDKQPHA